MAVATWLFAGLLFIHLVSVQLAAAGPLAALLIWGSAPDASVRLSRRLLGQSLGTLGVGVVSGLLMGWLATILGHRDYTGILTRYYPRIWWGGGEVIFSALVMTGLWLLLPRLKGGRAGRVTAWLLAVATSLNLLYHFPPLLTILSHEVQTPTLAPLPQRAITSAEYRGMLVAPLVISKSLHFVIAAFATTGGWLLLVGTRPLDDDAEEKARVASIGGKIALTAISLQMLSGIWLFLQLDFHARSRLLGEDPVAAGALPRGDHLRLLRAADTRQSGSGRWRTAPPTAGSGPYLRRALRHGASDESLERHCGLIPDDRFSGNELPPQGWYFAHFSWGASFLQNQYLHSSLLISTIRTAGRQS